MNLPATHTLGTPLTLDAAPTQAIRERSKAIDAILTGLTSSHSTHPHVRNFLELDAIHTVRASAEALSAPLTLSQTEVILRFALLGDSGVGRSALIRRFAEHCFDPGVDRSAAGSTVIKEVRCRSSSHR